MATIWAIKDWGKHYERAESRKLNKLTWVPIQNKHDGKSFRRLMRLPDGLAIFGAFIILVELASKSPKASRGLLTDSDGPLTLPDISDKTGMSQEIIRRSLEVLSSKDIAWIEEKILPESPDAPPQPPEDPGNPPGYIEGDGRVGNGSTEQDITEKPAERASVPTPQKSAPLEDPNLKESDPGYWVERLYGRHPKKKDLVLVAPELWKVWQNASNPLDKMREVDAGHITECASAEWLKDDGRWCPTLAKWITDRGWTKQPAPLRSALSGMAARLAEVAAEEAGFKS